MVTNREESEERVVNTLHSIHRLMHEEDFNTAEMLSVFFSGVLTVIVSHSSSPEEHAKILNECIERLGLGREFFHGESGFNSSNVVVQ